LFPHSCDVTYKGNSVNITANMLQVSTLHAKWRAVVVYEDERQHWCVYEFLNAEHNAFIEIQWHLKYVHANMSTVRWWARWISEGGSESKEISRSDHPCIAATKENEEKVDQMIEQRMQVCAGLQEQYEITGDNRVIRDETWVYHYKPESNWQYLE
jgi:hypothetical protein